MLIFQTMQASLLLAKSTTCWLGKSIHSRALDTVHLVEYNNTEGGSNYYWHSWISSVQLQCMFTRPHLWINSSGLIHHTKPLSKCSVCKKHTSKLYTVMVIHNICSFYYFVRITAVVCVRGLVHT